MTRGSYEHVTPREADVLTKLLADLNEIETARELDIAVETVRMHVKHLHAKLRTRHLHSLVLWAASHKDCCITVNANAD